MSNIVKLEGVAIASVVKFETIAKASIKSVLGCAATDYTKSLLHMEGTTTTFVDEKGISWAGTHCSQSDVACKFGSKSAYFDGDDTTQLYCANAGVDFGAGNFTIDFWCKRSAGYLVVGNIEFYSGTPTDQAIGFAIFSAGDSQIAWTTDGATQKGGYTATHLYSAGDVWRHYALVRNGTTITLYEDGYGLTSQSCGTDDIFPVTPFWIGNNRGGVYKLTGYIDEFRISKGIARWTGDFTPPAAAYTVD